MKGDKFDNPPIMFAVTESELQRFRKTETENTLLKVQIEGLKKELEQFKKDIIEIEKLSDSRWEENEQLKEKNKILEAKNFEKCPFRYSDMGCDYCDWKDRDLKEEYEKELQEEQHEQRMFDLQCQNYDFDYGDVKY